jgi:hypothetical protein
MAKKKAETKEKVVGPSIWDQIVDSVNDENRETVLSRLKDAVEFLEQTKDKELAAKFKEAIRRIG